ncbi:protein-disulfide reductase DsbD [Comamonas sp. Y6]|uniref:Thiol:disulfide interchange protein DsbD n=1 Tax=Comamonas resistens TaxID=3046670 RepID=A0ABY8SQD2_9BURK|nr:protein-disulfide reductase DsbD [Comamonas resistens]MDL5035860.1 protein-disulfide reductase DsbD [Comamonas resistens]WHS65267.1 protein-disulfide reductase DsbD [Comamonas resistens]HBP0978942.1 protein-disulfide reductase DsbD [Pseudomonas aeruginosa]
MAFYRRVVATFLLCCCAVGSAWADGLFSSQGSNERQFLDVAKVFTLDPAQQLSDSFSVIGHVAEGYYVYRHAIKLVDAQGHDVSLTLPTGTAKHDEFFGDTEIYTGDVLKLRFPANATGPLTLHWQGCAEAGICYPPQTMDVDVPAMAAVTSTSGDGSVQGSSAMVAESSNPASVGGVADMAEDQAVAHRLAALGPVWGTLLFFGFGLLLAFTPCSLPMVPIISTMVVGSQAKPRRAFFLSMSYVLAMAGTYAAVGVAAGLAGANLQATLQSPWLLGAFAALFLVLASSLFGLFELQIPSALINRVESAGRNRSGGSIPGAAALGFLSALLVGPCMTAPLAGALLYIGQTGSEVYGGLALFALGLGMGLPLLAIAVFGARILPRPGAWMDRVCVAFGYVMVGMAVMMLARFLPGTVSLVLWGAWVLSMAIGLIAWGQAVAAKHRLAWTLRSGAVFAGLWSILMLVGAASGGDSVLQPLAHLRGGSTSMAPAEGGIAFAQAKSIEDVDAHLAQAASRDQWTLIDIYADWCVSCHVIERNVFGDPAVASRLARMQVLRPDVTRNDATDQALLKRWGVMGPPTLILVGPDGKERRDLRVVGEIDARAFLDHLDKAGA